MPLKHNTAKLRKSPNGKWNFSLLTSNGKVVASSNQGYENKAEAKRIIRKYFPYFELDEDTKAVAKLHKQLARGRR